MATLPSRQPKHTDDSKNSSTHNPIPDWSCLSCFSDGVCGSYSTIRPAPSSRGSRARNVCRFTESQAMGLALILAEQYVLASEPYSEDELESTPFQYGIRPTAYSSPCCATMRLPSTASPPSTCSPSPSDYVSTPPFSEKQTFLSTLPLKSTRSSRASRPPTASSSSTVCDTTVSNKDTGPRGVHNDSVAGGVKRSSALKKPVKWIRRLLA
ncbi:hypothetical protein GQ54DRAFT_295272 [Martensiomyces pterosporus]|nr:hypothetical protein GQ54DRAFT_295272 [Martensiomyces pterosporus]